MTVLVLVENIEDEIREVTRIAEREELLVYSAEFCLVQLSTGAIFQKALVPKARKIRALVTGGTTADREQKDHCCSSRLSTSSTV